MRPSWAFADETGSNIQSFDALGRVDLDGPSFQGFMECDPIAPDMLFYRVEGTGPAPYRLAASAASPPGMLVLGCMLTGAGEIVADGNSPEAWRNDGSFYALTPYRRTVAYHVRPGTTWRSLAIKLGPRAIERVANDDLLPRSVRVALRNAADPFATSRGLGIAMARVANDLSRPPYAGRLSSLYREAKVLELLALQLDALSDEPASDAAINTRALNRIREARDRLVADLANPPSLHDLADAVGLSAKRLNLGFRELYGTTVFTYLRDARLDHARELLEDGADQPLKQIAWQVGYSQLSNFINAYRRRYGLSPGLHKRLRSEES